MKPSETAAGSAERNLFVHALEKPAGKERVAFLEGACVGKPELRRRLEALLQQFEALGTFLEESVIPPPEAGSTAGAPELLGHTVKIKDTNERMGDKIGRYKLLQPVGEGGCGIVYMAEQEEPVRRRVALKVIKLGMDTRQVIARFEAERQALALMDHPNIAKVLDAGATETGRPYFVMELVRGIKITEYCDQNNLSTRQRLDLFIAVCQAIQHAHQKGIIHRDIKPSNILVTLHDGVPVPKVIDFGIAKATEGRLTDQTLFTAFEQFIGTPAYMSPEQAEMSGLDIDTRSDIYSLGVLLYELLTGRTPLDTKELLAAGLDELRRTIRERDPLRPSTRLRSLVEEEQTTAAKRRGIDLPSLIHLLSGDLDWIVMKCLEKDRTCRYETANGLAMDIQRHLNNEPVLARPPSGSYRLRKLIRRNRVAFAAGAAVAATLVVGTFISAWLAIRAENESRKAQIAQQNEAKQRQLADNQRRIAVEQRQAAVERSRVLRRQSYVSDMRSAFQAMQENGSDRAKLLLERYRHPQTGEEDLRGFEWRYLWAACQSDEQPPLAGLDAWANCAVLSPDWKVLALGGFSTNVAIVNVASKGLITNLTGFDGFIDLQGLAFSRDGRRLAAKGGHTIGVWNTGDWRQLFHWTNGEPNFTGNNSVVISPDDATLATRIQGGAVGFWDLSTGRPLPELTLKGSAQAEMGTQLGTVMAYSPDGKLLVVSELNHLQVRDARSLTLATNLIRQNFLATDAFDSSIRVMSIAFSTNYLAAGYRDGELKLWDPKTWRELVSCKAHSSFLHSLDFSPDGEVLATGGEDADIGLWTVANLVRRRFWNNTGRPDSVLKGHVARAYSVKFDPEGRTLVSCDSEGVARQWSVPRGLNKTINSDDVLWISNDGEEVITSKQESDSYLQFWDKSGKQKTQPFKVPDLAGSCRAVSLDGKSLAVGRANGAIELWDIDKKTFIEPFGREESWACQIAFSADGRSLVTAHVQGGIKIRTLPAGSKSPMELRNLLAPFTLSPDGKLIAAPSKDRKELELWDVSHPQRVGKLNQATRTGPYRDVPGVFSPDGKLFAFEDNSLCQINVWDVASGALQRALPHPGPFVNSIAFSPDGRTLVGSTVDALVFFWNTANWEELLRDTTYFHPEEGSFVVFSANGEWLALRGPELWDRHESVVVWHAPSLSEIDAVAEAKPTNAK